MIVERTCERCGQPVERRRAESHYCSSACRQAVYRARKAGVTASDPSRVTAAAPRSVTASEPAYVGGPCPDPLRCKHWKRYPNGPWTCRANHPREPSHEHVAERGR